MFKLKENITEQDLIDLGFVNTSKTANKVYVNFDLLLKVNMRTREIKHASYYNPPKLDYEKLKERGLVE